MNDRLFSDKNLSIIIIYSVLFLFFFQLISDFIAAIYAIGLLKLSMPVEMVSLLFLFSPVILIFLRRTISKYLLIVLIALVLICRVVEVTLETRGRMIVAGLGVSCFLLLFPSLLISRTFEAEDSKAGLFGSSLLIALLLSVLFRTLNSGIDLSAHRWFQSIGWILAGVAGISLFRLVRTETKSTYPEERFSKSDTGQASQLKAGKLIGLSFGMTSVFVLFYFAFMSPNVIARWTGANYIFILSMMMLALSLFTFVLVLKPQTFAVLKRKFIFIWNVLFVLFLVSTIIMHQVKFPLTPEDYPINAAAVAFWQYVPLIFMLISFPVILVDFTLYAQELSTLQPSARAVGGSFALASLFFLVMICANIFTTVYDYIPVVGPFFRDKFWLVFLLPGIVLTLPVLLIGKPSFKFFMNLKKSYRLPVFTLIIGFTIIMAAFLTSATPTSRPKANTVLKILTYNIQQGYDKNGIQNYAGQLKFLQTIHADVIGLQETDTNRISGGNVDLVRYFAEKLNLYSYYGPKTVVGTFGIALLSKYPIENPRTFYMYSEGEQTATIAARITVQGKSFNIFVTHIGNGGPVAQQKAILKEIDSLENVVALGDFNFKPDSEQYRLTTEILADAWQNKWPHGVDNQGLNPLDRIDHIFVSDDFEITDCQYLIKSQSDHPAVSVQLKL